MVIQLNRNDINGAANFIEGKKMEGWADIRNFFLEQACKYQTSVKLWDAQKPGGPLHQTYPTFLPETERRAPLRKTKFEVPLSVDHARGQLKRLIKSCEKTALKVDDVNNNNLDGWDLIKVSKGLSRILNLCSYYIPNEAHGNENIHNLIR